MRYGRLGRTAEKYGGGGRENRGCREGGRRVEVGRQAGRRLMSIIARKHASRHFQIVFNRLRTGKHLVINNITEQKSLCVLACVPLKVFLKPVTLTSFYVIIL